MALGYFQFMAIKIMLLKPVPHVRASRGRRGCIPWAYITFGGSSQTVPQLFKHFMGSLQWMEVPASHPVTCAVAQPSVGCGRPGGVGPSPSVTHTCVSWATSDRGHRLLCWLAVSPGLLIRRTLLGLGFRAESIRVEPT